MDMLWFAGIDWADRHHDVVILDSRGERVGSHFQVEHTPAGLASLLQRLRQVVGEQGPSAMACVLEIRQGLLVHALVEAGFAVYPVNPFLVKERRKASRAKTDAIDALILARIGRSELADLHRLQPDSPVIAELKELTRDQDQLIRDQTRILNQLTACLKAYYPQALTLFSDLDHPCTIAFLRAYPTPGQARASTAEQIGQVLREAKYPHWRSKAKALSELVQQPALQASAVTVRSKSRLLLVLLAELELLHAQIEAYDQEITTLFLSHNLHTIIQSLPRAGTRIAPRLLAELGDQMDRYAGLSSLQALAGTRPVPYASGNFHEDRARRACLKPLRNALYQLAWQSTLEEGWAKELYQKKRKEGKKHAESVRIVSNVWVRILFAMLVHETVYDASLFEQAQHTHAARAAEVGVA